MTSDRSSHAPDRHRPAGTTRPRVPVRRGLAGLLGALALVAVGCTGATDGADQTTTGASPATSGTDHEDGGTTDTATNEDSATPVPDLEVEAFDGDTVTIDDYRGTPLVVNFWASWCPPCVAEMPDLEAVHQASNDQVAFVGVNTQDTVEAAEDLVEQTGVTYDLVRDPDGELFRAFGVFGMPSTFYVDASGAIVHQHTGLLTRDDLVDDLEAHLGVTVTSEP